MDRRARRVDALPPSAAFNVSKEGTLAMRFSENHKIAVVVLVVCILVSVVGFGGIGLARERGKVLAVFEEGVEKGLSTRYSVDAYLGSARDSARLMASEAQLLKVSDPLVQNVSGPAEQIADASLSLDARYSAYESLKSAVEALYNAAMDASKQAGSFENFKFAYDDFWGYDDMIDGDEYHQMARDYNKLASGFPAGLVASITGQGKLNTFGG